MTLVNYMAAAVYGAAWGISVFKFWQAFHRQRRDASRRGAADRDAVRVNAAAARGVERLKRDMERLNQ
jgi:hypothetical protein